MSRRTRTRPAVSRRNYCISDTCPGQTPVHDQGRLGLARYSTADPFTTTCPHCHQPLATRKPPDGGVRELDPPQTNGLHRRRAA
jgi:hypothetical protein